jgi:hypothetical protein
MRFEFLALFAMVTATAYGDDSPNVTVTVAGKKVTFPEKGFADGVKASIGVLESCCAESLYEADELKKAEEGEHVRLVFAEPITVRVLSDQVEVSELVVRLPMGTGVLWVKSGDKVRRFAKFRPETIKPFTDWVDQALPAK